MATKLKTESARPMFERLGLKACLIIPEGCYLHPATVAIAAMQEKAVIMGEPNKDQYLVRFGDGPQALLNKAALLQKLSPRRECGCRKAWN